MPTQKLSQTAAFAAGSDLWIFGDPTSSAFARKIDFYLNFQIARSEGTERKVLSPALLAILKANDLEELNQSTAVPQRWLVSTRRKLPCLQVVVIPAKKHGPEWVQEALKIWNNLRTPSLRLFLPNLAAGPDSTKLIPADDARITYVAGDLTLDV
jgi:hypothetical protein